MSEARLRTALEKIALDNDNYGHSDIARAALGEQDDPNVEGAIPAGSPGGGQSAPEEDQGDLHSPPPSASPDRLPDMPGWFEETADA